MFPFILPELLLVSLSLLQAVRAQPPPAPFVIRSFGRPELPITGPCSTPSPVCGSDGRTYISLCALFAAGQGVFPVYDGPCKEGDSCRRDCPELLIPEWHCGTDGRSYGSLCELQQSSCKRGRPVAVAFKAQCDEGCKSIACSEGTPVCGSDGRSYPSGCELEKANACSYVEGGPISTPRPPNNPRTSTTPRPSRTTRDTTSAAVGRSLRDIPRGLIATDGEETSPVVVDEQEETVAEDSSAIDPTDNRPLRWKPALPIYDGPCRKEDCNMLCTKDYLPLCGSDNVTYSNPCTFANAQCSNPALELQYPRACDDECNSSCSEEFAPVCGSDFQTYDNLCLLDTEACKTKTFIGVLHTGPCRVRQCNTRCTREQRPVCGTDGVTYANHCMLLNENCTPEKVHVDVLMEGPCKKDCGRFKCRSPDFLCGPGKDGARQTYLNKCMLDVAACNLGTPLKQLYRGMCNFEIVEGADVASSEDDGGCPSFCTLEYMPVCGSDGRQYPNLCALKRAACKAGAPITETPCNSE